MIQIENDTKLTAKIAIPEIAQERRSVDSPEVNDLIGVSWQAGGQGPHGYDCYGLAVEIARRRGYELPEQQTAESVVMRLNIFDGKSSEYLSRIIRPQPWDLVIFDHRLLGLHVGTMTAEPKHFIHVGEMTRSVLVGRLGSPLFSESIYGFYRCRKKLKP